MMNLVFLGPPGAGKGTQAKIVSEKLGIPHISTGDMLREAIASGTELGKKVEEIVKSGQLVSDDLMARIVEERLAKDDCTKGFILDGYPRTIPQVHALEEILKKLSKSLDAVIFIDVEEEELVRRITSRRVCPKCHAVYSLISSPPKEDEICDKCGTKLVQRDDDKEETVRDRYKIYLEKTQPIVSYYEKNKLLKRIDGKLPVEEVTKMILEALGRI